MADNRRSKPAAARLMPSSNHNPTGRSGILLTLFNFVANGRQVEMSPIWRAVGPDITCRRQSIPHIQRADANRDKPRCLAFVGKELRSTPRTEPVADDRARRRPAFMTRHHAVHVEILTPEECADRGIAGGHELTHATPAGAHGKRRAGHREAHGSTKAATLEDRWWRVCHVCLSPPLESLPSG